jgi:hypothetical protein
MVKEAWTKKDGAIQLSTWYCLTLVSYSSFPFSPIYLFSQLARGGKYIIFPFSMVLAYLLALLATLVSYVSLIIPVSEQPMPPIVPVAVILEIYFII